MRIFILLGISLSMLLESIMGQQLQGKVLAPLAGRRNVNEMVVLDTGYVRVLYALNADDINEPQSYIDLQCLEIGNYFSKYYSYFVFNNDSLVWNWLKEHPNSKDGRNYLGPLGKMRYYWSEYKYSEYFKDYRANLLTEYARMPFGVRPDYRSIEKGPVQDWNIGSDTLSVAGYLCQQATCFFRGRYYTAWFAKDIPVSNGPWKFGGLPGLILKICDNNKFYTWECIKIEHLKFPLKRYDFSHYKPVERLKLLKLQRMLNEDFYKVVGVRSINGGKLPGPVSYEPLELE